jgi:F-type H+-transporting ATPase subunit b
MISLDYSLIAAIALFLSLVVALNYLLFKPILKIQAERESRTSGQMEDARKKLDRQMAMFNRYQESIKNARMDGYRLQEHWRSEAAQQRAEAIAHARQQAEGLIEEARTSIKSEVRVAKETLDQEAGEIARSIADLIMQRSA